MLRALDGQEPARSYDMAPQSIGEVIYGAARGHNSGRLLKRSHLFKITKGYQMSATRDKEDSKAKIPRRFSL